MNRYVEMGFSETCAHEAIHRFGDDLHAGCHWLMTRQSMGSAPKRLKRSHERNKTSYVGSIVRFVGLKYVVDAFDEKHGLIRIRQETCHTVRWEHSTDTRIEWISIQHQKNKISVPQAAWKRQIGRIDYALSNIDDENRAKCTRENILSMIITHGRPDNSVGWDIWRAIVSLTREFVHEPSGIKPGSLNSRDIHEFRVEWMTYFHAVADVYGIPPDDFSDSIYNESMQSILNQVPEEIRQDLKQKIEMWQNPQPYMRKMLNEWRKNCLPLVLFECSFLDKEYCTLNVIIHDMTFVRPNKYEAGIHMQLQRLFFHIYPQPRHQRWIGGLSLDSGFLQGVLQSSRKKNNPVCVNPPEIFKTELFPYQKKCLHWLIHRETTNSTSAWGWKSHKLPDGFVFYTSIFGHFSLSPPNRTTFGGLLAQDVGMGKTVEMLSLIATHKTSGPTLVVVPTTMLAVWMSEAKKHVPSFSVIKFHGARRTKDMNILKSADIVLTTYRVVVNETSQHVPTIGGIRWGRIILDESHEMKTVHTATSRAVCRLYAPFRWCVSATPWPRDMANVSSMLAFLGVTPFDEPQSQGIWSASQLMIRNSCYFTPSLFHNLLTEMTLWQKKRHVRLSLPAVSEQTILCKNTFEPIYKYLLELIQVRMEQDELDTNVNSRTRRLHYIRWLRQLSIHPRLNNIWNYGLIAHNRPAHSESTDIETFLKSLGSANYDQSLRDIIDSWRNGNEKCSICMDAMDRPTLTPCHHMFCYECIQSSYQHDNMRKCPLCRAPAGSLPLEELTLEHIQPEAKEEETNCYIPDLKGNQIEIPREMYQLIKKSEDVVGPKIQKIIDIVKTGDEKIIVFTQFHNAWKYLCQTMTNNNISFVSIEGKMTPKQRFNSIEKFQNDSNIRVFAMTTKTASVGITLTAGSHIIFLEPCENEAIRKQAVGRAWRIGQKRPVTITTLKTEGTVDTVKTRDVITHLNANRLVV
jgi:hypothetical protein